MAIAAILVIAGLAMPSAAHDDRGVTRDSFPGAAKFDRNAAYRYSQSAVDRQVGDYSFTAAGDRQIRMSGYRGKPLILSFVYTSCFHTCPLLTKNLARAVAGANRAIGSGRFSVLTVGFDTAKDSPEAMRLFAKAQGVDVTNWQFVSASAPTVERLAADTGFIYFRSPNGFDHLTQTTVIGADGRVYAQIYGDDFDVPRLVEPLKQLIFGTSRPFSSFDALVNKVRLFCTVYDPTAGKYRFDYSLFIGMAMGSLVFLFAGIFLVRNIRRLRRQPAGAGPDRA